MSSQSLIPSLVFSAPYNRNYKMETSVDESCHHYLTPKTSLNGSEIFGLRHIPQQHFLNQSEDSLMMIFAFAFLK